MRTHQAHPHLYTRKLWLVLNRATTDTDRFNAIVQCMAIRQIFPFTTH